LCGSDGVAALTRFREILGVAMVRAGFKRRISHDTPHLTLLYSDRLVAEQAIESIAWTVSEFTLVRSLIGLHRYEPLGRWSLLP
jgi:2'-5' RNA ligase